MRTKQLKFPLCQNSQYYWKKHFLNFSTHWISDFSILGYQELQISLKLDVNWKHSTAVICKTTCEYELFILISLRTSYKSKSHSKHNIKIPLTSNRHSFDKLKKLNILIKGWSEHNFNNEIFLFPRKIINYRIIIFIFHAV